MRVANKPVIRADVYHNLNLDSLSIRSRERHNYGRVVAYADSVMVEPADFIVQPAGRRRVVETGRRNVHAFVRGVTMKYDPETPDGWTHVTYNPFERGEFYRTETGDAIDSAHQAVVTVDGVYVPPRG